MFTISIRRAGHGTRASTRLPWLRLLARTSACVAQGRAAQTGRASARSAVASERTGLFTRAEVKVVRSLALKVAQARYPALVFG